MTDLIEKGHSEEEALEIANKAGVQSAYLASIPDMKVPNKYYLNMTKAVLYSLEEVIYYLQKSSK